MRRNTFEIFPADQGRFAWRLVAGDREVARSTRTYRSRKRVRKAIGAARRADVVQLGFSAQNGPFVLRPREFELVQDVNQLLVGEIPRRSRRRREPRNAALQAEAKQETAVAGELRAEGQAETAVAGELREQAATEAVVGVAAGAEEAVEAAVAKAGVADALEGDAETLETDAKAEAAKAKPARRGRGTRGWRRPVAGAPGTDARVDAPVDAWLEVIGAPDALVRPVVCGLGEQGVQLCSRNGTPGRPHHGVVLFAGSRAAAADSIDAVADGGCERILALSAAGDRLGSASWSLLRAGASDVFNWHDASSARQVSERLRRWQAIDELADCPLVHELGQSPSSRRSSAWLEHSSRSITVSIAAHGRASISLNAIWAGDTSRATLGAMAIWSANDTATSWRVDSNRTRQQDVGQPWPGSCSVDPA